MPFSAEDEDAESKLAAELIAERKSDSIDPETIDVCPQCTGARLNPIARAVQVQGYTIDQVTATPISQALSLVNSLKFSGNRHGIATDILSEIRQRLLFMQQVGLDYLTLDRDGSVDFVKNVAHYFAEAKNH